MVASRIILPLFLIQISIIFANSVANPVNDGSSPGVGVLAGSNVQIYVGEKFWGYTLNGWTDTNYKISIAGQYYNNEAAYSGVVQFWLVVDVGITRYDAYQKGSTMQFRVQSFDNRYNRWNNFNFEIICPQPATSADLRYGMTNATTLFVMGPSRSALA